MIYKFKDAEIIKKHDVNTHIYNSSKDCPQAAVVYQETEKGHSEEFYHENLLYSWMRRDNWR